MARLGWCLQRGAFMAQALFLRSRSALSECPESSLSLLTRTPLFFCRDENASIPCDIPRAAFASVFGMPFALLRFGMASEGLRFPKHSLVSDLRRFGCARKKLVSFKFVVGLAKHLLGNFPLNFSNLLK